MRSVTPTHELTMTRKGTLTQKVLDSTGATQKREIKPGDDPWKAEDE